MLSVVIPSRNEKFLEKTIRDVLEKATGDIEIFVLLNDHTEPVSEVKDDRVKYIRLNSKNGETLKRQCINWVAEHSKGKYLMALDAHCMMAEGFDTQLAKDHQPNWVQIPRRHRLDAENWCLQTQVDKRPPIDYEYTIWPLKFDPPGLHGFKWDERTLTRWNIPIDETMHFQGSCWFMTKKWFNKCGLMRIEGYSGWGQEAEEISFETRKRGGKIITNKKTWYAHLHKGPKYGRMYYMSRQSMRDCNKFSYNHWVHENKDLFISYIEKFWPLPTWPENWKEQIYG